MKNYLNIVENLNIKKPNKLLYWFISFVFIFMFKKKYQTKVNYIDDPRKEKGSYLLLGNHPSINDFGIIMPSLLPHTFNIVGAYSNFFRKNLHKLFLLGQIIPKKRNCPDVSTIKNIIKIIRQNGRVMMFPEGVSSINGASQPVMPGIGKLIKLLKVPVYCAITEYTSFLLPKYDETFRKGKTKLTFKKLLSKEEVENLDYLTIEDKLNECLYVDPYKDNLIDNNSYIPSKKHLINQNLEDLLYLCPKCNNEFKNYTHDEIIECSHCQNKIKVTKEYQLIPLENSISPKSIKCWHDLERIKIKEEIESNEDFEYEVQVKLGMLDKYNLLGIAGDSTSKKVGEGIVKVSKNGLTYEGSKNNNQFSFTLSSLELPTLVMTFDCNIVHLFYKNELYEFTFYRRGDAIKLTLIVEEMHRIMGGNWKNYKFFKYDKKECFKK